jgi:hypothetical protein
MATKRVSEQVERGLAEGPWSLNDHGKKCETKLKSNPYDLECWNVLVREAQVWIFISSVETFIS